MEESEGRNPDPGRRESDVRTDRNREKDPRSREAKTENATQRRHELAQSSQYPVCHFYLKSGRCDYGGRCKFNHPPLPQRNQMSNEMVQTSPYPVRPQLPEIDQMRHGMVQTSPYPVRPQLPERTQMMQIDGANKLCKFFRSGDCKHGSDFLDLHAMDSAPMRQATTESSSMAAKEIPKNHKVNVQENLQRQEQADMERRTREAGEKAQEQLCDEARSRMDQMKPTVPSDNVDQVRESLTDLGIERKEGDGF